MIASASISVIITHHPSLLRASPAATLYHRAPRTALTTSPRPLLAAASAPRSLRPSAPAPRSLPPAAGGASPVDSHRSYPPAPTPPGTALLGFVRSNFLPLALVGGIMLGLLDPTLGCLAHKYSFSKYSTFGIFFISGLTLRTKEMGAAVEAWPAGLFGLASILLFTPFISRFVMQIQFFPREFITGLAMFCCMPTTLSSGVTLTQIVGGNSALALAMTVISNLLGIMFVPFSLSKYIGVGTGVSLPTEQLFKSLVSTLLVPLILGKIARETSKVVAEFVDRNRQGFSMTSAILLSLVPWIQVSKSRSLLLSVQAKSFAIAVGIGVLVHFALLAFNVIALQIFSSLPKIGKSVFARKEYARAVILVASQKTLPVLVAVVEQLGGALGESGFLVIPGVASHISQIIIDSMIVNWWRQRDQKSATA